MTASLPMIWLVRHGATEWSRTGQHTGVTDLPLTLEGEAMAAALAPRLAGLMLGHTLVSPRLRARQTCRLSGCGPPGEIDCDLAEWNYGRYEGLTSPDIRHIQPGWSIWRDGCPDGEAPADVAGRADRLIARLLDLEGPVALFSHGHLCTALALRWLGLALVHGPHFPLSPASLSLLTCAPGEPDRRVLGLWNEVALPSQCEGPISHGRGSAERST